MKKLSKSIFAVFLTITLILSATITSFAGDDGNPIGKCIFAPIYNTVVK